MVEIEKDWNFLLVLVEVDWSELKWVEVGWSCLKCKTVKIILKEIGRSGKVEIENDWNFLLVLVEID